MTESPDPEKSGRRLVYQIQLWGGGAGAILGAVVALPLQFITGGEVSSFTLLVTVGGAVMALLGWRGLRREDSNE